MENNSAKMILAAALLAALGFIAGLMAGCVPSARDYYSTELAYMVSPTDIIARMGANDTSYVLMDVRDPASYAKGHALGAVSVPYEQISSYEVPEGKELIVYCWAHSCMLSRKAGLAFAERGIAVKELNIGWNEWSSLQYPSEGTGVNWTYKFTTYCGIDGSEGC